EDFERVDVLLLGHRDDPRLERLACLDDQPTRRRRARRRRGERALWLRRGSSGPVAWRSTSPVDGSTTSAAANAPSSSASAISTNSTPAFLIAASALEVIFLPAWVTTSLPALMSFAARSPWTLSPTPHRIAP